MYLWRVHFRVHGCSSSYDEVYAMTASDAKRIVMSKYQNAQYINTEKVS